ncbi:MAG: NAD-dependent malic enzyme [Chloroflexi bacterium]|nr:NAD-dependent malic enzyme [Chloroflexota bacterium]
MASRYPAVQYSITVRAEYSNSVGMLAQITSTISRAGGDLGAIDIVSAARDWMIRDITVNARDEQHAQEIVKKVKGVPGVRVLNISDQTFLMHLGGKIEMRSKVALKTRNDMSMAYTPGVARVCMAIHNDPKAVWTLTSKANTVAIVSDGTAVLGLGDIGPDAAMPVMEGKALLFKELAGVDAWPICVRTKDPDAIVENVKLISTGFGGVNLEDISAPRCFYIEERLREEADIPVFHDDQHGTSVVVLAALTNALRIVEKHLDEVRVVMTGAGAGGIATAKLLIACGARNIVMADRQGLLCRGRDYGDNPYKAWIAEHSNPHNLKGSVGDAMEGADVFIGLSGPGVLTAEHVKRMNKDAIVFALANPDPEVWPEEALPHVRIMATGRSDYPNQVNNALCFPGLFRGILDVRARQVTTEMEVAAAEAIAGCLSPAELSEEYIIPSIFDRSVVRSVSRAVAQAAMKAGVAQRTRRRGVGSSAYASAR